eukprot:5328090-Amphidinium_carterae.2
MAVSIVSLNIGVGKLKGAPAPSLCLSRGISVQPQTSTCTKTLTFTSSDFGTELCCSAGTSQARQFEFHPSLPSVLLVGDQQAFAFAHVTNSARKDKV